MCLGLSHLTVLVPELLTLQLTQCAQSTSLPSSSLHRWNMTDTRCHQYTHTHRVHLHFPYSQRTPPALTAAYHWSGTSAHSRQLCGLTEPSAISYKPFFHAHDMSLERFLLSSLSSLPSLCGPECLISPRSPPSFSSPSVTS